jgi:glycosyltransferase involved in cell wall biosynthesis
MLQTQISFIVSCYNSDQYLDGLVENLLQQDIDEYEIIIVDSASQDDSVAIAKRWQSNDRRVGLIQQPKRTPYGVSWLDGWKAACGRVVGNSNTDDRSYQWRARKVMDAMRGRNITRDVKPPAFYYGGYETRVDGVTTAKGVPPPYSVEDMSQLFRCGVHVHWDNGLRNKVDWGLMYERAYQYKSAFDYWLVLYFMSLGAEGIPINSCFSIYNQRKDSLEQSDKERNTFESLRAIEEFFPTGPAITALERETRVISPEWYERYRNFCKQFS